jgi:hypothetical protein
MVNMFEPKVFELVHGYFSRTLLATENASEGTLVTKDDIMMVSTELHSFQWWSSVLTTHVLNLSLNRIFHVDTVRVWCACSGSSGS